VLISTTWERRRRSYRQCYAYRVPGWRSDYSQEFEIETLGRLRVEIRTKKHRHRAEYRIDGDKGRPVREHRDKLELRLEDHFYEIQPRREPPFQIPRGSLWDGSR
jgi:hypothetical protein